MNLIIIIFATVSAKYPGEWMTGKLIGFILRESEKLLKEEDKQLLSNPLYTSQLSAWIGILERVLIIWLVLLDAIPAVSFLIILKSIARYEDHLKKKTDAAVFIIGTLCSFIVGIAFGVFWKMIM